MPRKNLKIGGRSLALDARPDRLDLRDRPYRPRLGNLPVRWPSDPQIASWLPHYVEAGLVRDQGEDGACTGFGLAAVINYLHFVEAVRVGAREHRHSSPAMLYQLAQMYDEWPGESYEGSSCRGALKGWHHHGVCRDPLWPYVLKNRKRVFVPPKEDPEQREDPDRNWDVDALECTLGVYYRIDHRSVVDMQSAIAETGAIYCSATVHEGWDVKSAKKVTGHESLVRIRHVPKPKDGGGHAFALVGYNELGFVVQNSWGKDWASLGFALLPYEDWVSHGDDAWVMTLGVPRTHSALTKGASKGARLRSSRFIASTNDLGSSGTPPRPAGLIAGGDALTRKFKDVPEKYQPFSAENAYWHAVVLDRGFPLRNDITAKDEASALRLAAYDRPLAWLKEKGARKLLIYAHGGLNSEAASITRIRALGPYACAENIYPLFITWRSGPLETLSDMAEEIFARLGFGKRGSEPAGGWLDFLTEKTDRMLEPLLRAPVGAAWSQMKLNAVRASEHAEGGCRLMAAHLADLTKEVRGLEIHLIGHSAGAIVLGEFLRRMQEQGLRAASTRLFAPACTTRFALERYKPAIESKTLDARHFHVHVLSDKNERDDSVGPYRKSLLYLVSRALEEDHKTPLLGMDKSFDPATVEAGAQDDQWAESRRAEVVQWLKFWQGLGVDKTNRKAHVLERPNVSTGKGSIRSSHGCFDNAVDILGDALGYVVNRDGPERVKIHRLDY